MESRSTFVTVLAWLLIIGSGFAFVISLLQGVMVSVMFSTEEFNNLPEDAPATAQFMTNYFQYLIYAFSAFFLVMLTTSIAFLKRKNWARLVVVGSMIFGVFIQLVGLIMQFVFTSSLEATPGEEGFEDFNRMVSMMVWASVAISVVITGIHIWIITKLLSKKIVSEFKPSQPTSVEN